MFVSNIEVHTNKWNDKLIHDEADHFREEFPSFFNDYSSKFVAELVFL